MKQPNEQQIDITFNDRQILYLYIGKQIQNLEYPKTQMRMFLGFNSYLSGSKSDCLAASLQWSKYLRRYKFNLLSGKMVGKTREYFRKRPQCAVYFKQQLTNAITQIKHKFDYPPILGLLQMLQSQEEFMIVRYPYSLDSEINEYLKSCKKQLQQLNKVSQQQVYEMVALQVQPQLQYYIQLDKVQQLVQNYLHQIFENEFDQCKIIEIQINSAGKITILLCFDQKNLTIFEQKYKQKIRKCLKKKLVHKLSLQSIPNHLANKFLLFKSQNASNGRLSNQAILIQKIENLPEAMSTIYGAINESKQSVQRKIKIDKGIASYLKNIIIDLLNDSSTKQIFDKLRYQINEQKGYIELYGQQKSVQQLSQIIKAYTSTVENRRSIRIVRINGQQASLYDRINKQDIQAFENRNSWKLKLFKNIGYDLAISMGHLPQFSQKSPVLIIVHKNQGWRTLPFGISIFLRSAQEYLATFPDQVYNLQQLQQFKLSIDIEKGVKYSLHPMYENKFCQLILQQIRTSMFNEVIGHTIFNIGVVLPQVEQKQFILKIIELSEVLVCKLNIRIHIIANNESRVYKQFDMDTTKNYTFPTQDQRNRYYTIPEGQQPQKEYLSKFSNRQINEAIKDNKKQIYITSYANKQDNQCFYDHQDQQIIHLLGNKQIKAVLDGSKICFDLDGNTFRCNFVDSALLQGKKEFQKFYLGINSFNLETRQVFNIFTGQKKLMKQEYNLVQTSSESALIKININYELTTNVIQVDYDPHAVGQFKAIPETIEDFISSNKLVVIKKLEQPMSAITVQNIKSIASDNNIQIDYNELSQDIKLRGYQEWSIKNFLNILPQLLKSEANIKYPSTWQPQTVPIKIFVVENISQQFKNVQAAVTVGTIKKLIRIQNRYVYRKYMDEKACLKQLNEGKQIKQMMLFHGTRTTPPETIYMDKQQSFNINYTSNNNTMGRGTYFAQRSEYSYRYAFRNNEGERMMFYCSVLVGDSQQMSKTEAQRKDTDYKDKNKGIRYESTTMFLDKSNIFVVYKNRRAYPSYLITL